MQRRYFSSTPVWPYIAVVTCLFVFSLLAPQYWRQATQVEHALPAVPSSITPQLLLVPAGPAAPAAAAAEPVAMVDAGPVVVSRQDPVVQLTALNEFEAPRQEARLEPPVAERITLDPSIGEMPEPQVRSRKTPAPLLVPMPVPEKAPVIDGAPSSLARQTIDRIPALAASWPCPDNLLQHLRALAEYDLSRAWAEKAIDTLQQIHESPSLFTPTVGQQIESVASLSNEALELSQQADTDVVRAGLLRARYSIQRRVLVWGPIHRIVARGMDTQTVSVTGEDEMENRLGEIQERIRGSRQADSWRRFLMLDQLQYVAESDNGPLRRELARFVLRRIHDSQLDERQKDLLEQEPFQGLSTSLRRWAREPVDYLRLLEDIESYEQTRSSEAARQLASHYQVLRWSDNEEIERLAETLNTHYRNANVRVAVTADMINRVLPRPVSFEEDLQDQILGAHVRGTSQGCADLRVVLVPDQRRWRLGLEAHGDVASYTAATRGPATFFSDGSSCYVARKLLLVDPREMYTWRAEVDASSDLNLRGLETDYDDVPLLGWLVRGIAMQQHDMKYDEARYIATLRLENLASRRMDQEVHQQLTDMEEKFQMQWLEPLHQLKLQPIALDMRTTQDRLLVRCRLAGDKQLGAHTPRPQAPAGSLLSVQVHESALNNALQKLNLEGRRCELRDLYQELASTFRREVEIPEEVPDGVIIQFASDNAVRLDCRGGRVTITLRIAELRNARGKSWRNFAVRTYYVPDGKQLAANLVRDPDTSIELAGQRLNTLDQIALRGVFAKVFSRNRPVNVINEKLTQNPRLAEVSVTQFVVNDGWIGVAIGSQPTAPSRHASRKRRSDGPR